MRSKLIDEISKDTLNSYVKNASHDKAIHTRFDKKYPADKEFYKHRISKRSEGISKAISKLTKEDFDDDDVAILKSLTEDEISQLDEISRKALANYTQKAVINRGHHDRQATLSRVAGDDEGADKHNKKSAKRFKGILTATNRLAKENEELQEISAKTLGSYIRKASDAKSVAVTKLKNGEGTSEDYRKFRKRDHGTNIAVGKLTGNEGHGFKQKRMASEELQESEFIAVLRKMRHAGEGRQITFEDGHSTTLPMSAVVKALNHYDSLSPQEKGEQSQALQTSLESFKKTIGETEEMNERKYFDADELNDIKAKKKQGKQFAQNRKTRDKEKRNFESEEIAEIMARVNAGEELDEISKATLGSYIKKAKDSLADNSYENGRVDHQSTGQKFHRKSVQNKLKTIYKAQDKRHQGIHRAVERLTKESEFLNDEDFAILESLTVGEVESLDELSKATLASYAKKASNDGFMKARDSGIEHGSSSEHIFKRPDEYQAGQTRGNRALRKAVKRKQGIDRAINRLAKEELEDEDIAILEDMTHGDVEALDEISKSTLGSYIKKASRDAQSAERYQTHYRRDGDHDREKIEMKHKWKRNNGIAKAVNKLTKENEELQEMDLETAKAKAHKESKNGYAQHVNRHSDGKHSVSDWYDHKKTVASYENGRALREDELLEKKYFDADEIEDMKKNKKSQKNQVKNANARRSEKYKFEDTATFSEAPKLAVAPKLHEAIMGILAQERDVAKEIEEQEFKKRSK